MRLSGSLIPRFEHELGETMLLVLATDFDWHAQLSRRTPADQVMWELSTSKQVAAYVFLRITQLPFTGAISVRVELKAEGRAGVSATVAGQDIRDVRRLIDDLRATVGLRALF